MRARIPSARQLVDCCCPAAARRFPHTEQPARVAPCTAPPHPTLYNQRKNKHECVPHVWHLYPRKGDFIWHNAIVSSETDPKMKATATVSSVDANNTAVTTAIAITRMMLACR